MEAVLRLVHIGSGVLWAGGAFALSWFIGPNARSVGDAARPFMQSLITRSAFSDALFWASNLTALSGIALWAVIFGSDTPGGWQGAMLVIGVIAGLVAVGIGHARQRPAVRGLRRLSAEVAAADGPPSAAQASEMQRLQQQLTSAGGINAVIIAVAVAGMALGG